jgi:hypothetical protein
MRLACVAIVILYFHLFCVADTLGGDNLKAGLLQEFRTKALAIESFYRSLEYSAIVTKREFASVQGTEKIELYYRSNGARLRLDLRGLESSSEDRMGHSAIAVANPDGCFLAEKNPGNSEFVLGDYSRDCGSYESKVFANSYLGPVTFFDSTVLKFLEDPKLTVLGVEDIQKDGAKFKKVTFKYDKAAPGWFLFDVEKSWALCEYRWGLGKKCRREVVEYEGTHDKFPLMSKVMRWVEDDDQIYDREEVVVEKIRVGACPIDDFVPAAIGIKNFIPPNDNLPKRNMTLVVFFGLASLVLAWLVGRKWSNR